MNRIMDSFFFRNWKLCASFFCVLLCLHALPGEAQRDSISLEEVTIRSIAPVRYMAGLYVQRLDSLELQSSAFRRLDEILAQATSLSFRSYGNGQLSTIAFRGLSSNHTAVLWNGVNINMPTLGQTDFSTIPALSFDRLSVQYGAGASHLGSDAVGGSIVMENAPLSSEGISIRGGLELGSFSNSSGQEMIRYRTRINGQWSFAGKTQLYATAYRNQYPYDTFKGRRVERSDTFQKGFLQDLFFEDSKGRTVSAHLWWNDHDMTLSPDNPAGRERTTTGNFRTMVRYSDGKWQFRASFIRDIIDYGVGDLSNLDQSQTDRYGLRADRELKRQYGQVDLSVLAGGEFTLFKARVEGYETPRVSEGRGDVFLLTRLSGKSGWAGSVNFRQAFVEGYTVPFTPSVGLAYSFFKKGDYRLKMTASLGRSYRVPTLNERYWKDLGNPDIKPEAGFNKEAGLEQQARLLRDFRWESRINVFHNRVDNWVYWNPARNYRAENLQLVVARGVELHHYLSFNRGKWSAGIRSLVSYTRSTQERAYDAYSQGVLGKQLRFVPVWISNLDAFARFGGSTLTLQRHSESLRYINEIQSLPAFHLTNLLFEQVVRIGVASVRFQARAANVTNQLYFTVKSTAMPGRSYHVSLLADQHLLKSKQ